MGEILFSPKILKFKSPVYMVRELASPPIDQGLKPVVEEIVGAPGALLYPVLE
jgi:hypothetical protein